MLNLITAAIPVVIQDDSLFNEIPSGVYVIVGALIAAAAGWLTSVWQAKTTAKNAVALALLKSRIDWWQQLSDAVDDLNRLTLYATHNGPQSPEQHVTIINGLQNLRHTANWFPGRASLGECIRNAESEFFAGLERNRTRQARVDQYTDFTLLLALRSLTDQVDSIGRELGAYGSQESPS